MKIPNIFEQSGSHKYMACIGTNGYSDGSTYSIGFFGSARAMLKYITKDECENYEMDTLVYPILYSIRHGIELGIKHLLRRIHEIDESKFSIQNIEKHHLEDLGSRL